ncbi:hypothetical protein NN3_26310 [Nocardia neocaledoniensis NBRC 108232]|nr:hypothetical protein NN3_26310 [Nocardia neocaledoniensis NBRC 108232]
MPAPVAIDTEVVNDNTSITTTAAAPGPIAAAPVAPHSTLIPNPRCRDHSGTDIEPPTLSVDRGRSTPYSMADLRSVRRGAILGGGPIATSAACRSLRSRVPAAATAPV